MDYADWKALHDGYDAQRTVMYRKILVEEGNILEFFKTIYFFTECLAVIGTVPAELSPRSLCASTCHPTHICQCWDCAEGMSWLQAK